MGGSERIELEPVQPIRRGARVVQERNLAFVAFSQVWHRLDGQVFVLFVIVVAAAEAAVGLGIIIMISRNRKSLNVENVDLLKL